VALLYAAVKRSFGAGAGLAAGALLAMTPVAALMFRFNNPDALLVMLLVAAAYCLMRAIEQAGTRWILATGALVGFAFLAKMGQALLVVPGFGLAYLVAAPTGCAGARQLAAPARARHGVRVVGRDRRTAPASSRPFIDGSPDNNIFNLIFGYNGFSRIFGGGGPGAAAARVASASAESPASSASLTRSWAVKRPGCCQQRCLRSRSVLASPKPRPTDRQRRR